MGPTEEEIFDTSDQLTHFFGVFTTSITGYYVMPLFLGLAILTAIFGLVVSHYVAWAIPFEISPTIVMWSSFGFAVGTNGIIVGYCIEWLREDDEVLPSSRPYFTSYAFMVGALIIAPLGYGMFVIGEKTLIGWPILVLTLAVIGAVGSYYGAAILTEFNSSLSRYLYAFGSSLPFTTLFVSIAYPGAPLIRLIEGSGNFGFVVMTLLHLSYGVFAFFGVAIAITIIETAVLLNEKLGSD